MDAPDQPVDRLLITAIVDRLIFDDPETFSADDARALLQALPRKRVPWIEIGAKGQIYGGSTSGFAAGVGPVRMDDDRKRNFEVSSSGGAYIRAGQWKLLRCDRHPGPQVEIEQVMADPLDEGRGARLCFYADGVPFGMDIRIARNFRLLFSWVVVQIPGWKPWKRPG